MDLIKLLHGCVKVEFGKFVPGTSCPLQTKLKFDQNFKVFEVSALNFGVD